MRPTTPPMGWNSFDCFGSTVTEDEVLQNAEFVAAYLKTLGWNHIVVDYCWSHPNPPACTNPNQMNEFQPYLAMDCDFRLLPAVERFPSASDGRGFGPLADKIHAMGLKFGIHIMRGIPRQAMYPDYPGQTLGYLPSEIADPESTCPWLNHMFGVQIPGEAGQGYYDSLFRMYARWGVDFVKVDDLGFPYRQKEIEAIDLARRRCGRPMILSLSPGPCHLEHAAHVSAHADMWRICADFWDKWSDLRRAFDLLADWAPHQRAGAWPDADMLPLGRLSKRGPVGPEHDSFLSLEEQRTLLSLWCLFRSPLFMGGHLPETPSDTLNLLMNREVLRVHWDGRGGQPVYRDGESSIWVSQGSGGVIYIGLFNLAPDSATVGIEWAKIFEGHEPSGLRDLWRQTDVAISRTELAAHVPAHGCALFAARLSPSRRVTRVSDHDRVLAGAQGVL